MLAVDGVTAIIVAFVTAWLTALCAIAVLDRRQRISQNAKLHDIPNSEIIIFENDRIIKVSAAIRDLIQKTAGKANTWEDFYATFSATCKDLPNLIALRQSANGTEEHVSTNGLRIKIKNDQKRITVKIEFAQYGTLDISAVQAMWIQHERLRDMIDVLPNPIWINNFAGNTVYANRSFDEFVQSAAEMQIDIDKLAPIPDTPTLNRFRLSIPSEFGKAPKWFDITAEPIKNGWIRYAEDVTNQVSAEAAQRNFVQTLTKTFAHLSTGLVIFDNEKRLALFNPALIDLINVPVDFLSNRPNVFSFFDLLRERRILPEPKNYKDWRANLSALIEATINGDYSDIWNLPDGRTLQVVGRPHPNGAIAFFIEDITAEMVTRRNLRYEISVGKSLLDHISAGIVLISSDGSIMFMNRAMQDLIDIPSARMPNNTDQLISAWEQIFVSDPAFIKFLSALKNSNGAFVGNFVLNSNQGKCVTAKVSTILSNAVFVEFRPLNVRDQATLENLIDTVD